MNRLNVVEPLELEELELLYGAVCAALIVFGASSLDARMSAVVTGETYWLGLSLLDHCGAGVLCVAVLSGMLMVPVHLDGWSFREAR